jgi:hypothetical protein
MTAITTDQEIRYRPMFVSHYHVASRSYCRLIWLIHRFRSATPLKQPVGVGYSMSGWFFSRGRTPI